MPLTRHVTAEEDIILSVSTTVAGLVAKYNQSGLMDIKVLLTAVLGETALTINAMLENSNLLMTDKAVIRGDMKTLVNRALRPKLGMVDVAGGKMPAEALDAAKEGLKLVPTEEPNKG
jgi:hypothetical protein